MKSRILMESKKFNEPSRLIVNARSSFLSVWVKSMMLAMDAKVKKVENLGDYGCRVLVRVGYIDCFVGFQVDRTGSQIFDVPVLVFLHRPNYQVPGL